MATKSLYKSRIRLLGSPSAFFLIELLVAMALLTVGLLGIARLTTVVIAGNLSSRSASTASVLGQDLMEDARRSGTAGLPNTRIEDYDSIPGFPEFKRVMESAVNDPDPGLVTLTVTVYWDDDAKSLRLATILAP